MALWVALWFAPTRVYWLVTACGLPRFLTLVAEDGFSLPEIGASGQPRRNHSDYAVKLGPYPADSLKDRYPPTDAGPGLTALDPAEYGEGNAVKLNLWKAYLLVGALSVALYFLSHNPEFQMVLYDATGFVAVGAILVGVRRNRPAHRLPWLLVAGGLLAYTLGDAIWSAYDLVLHRPAPWPSAADFLWLACPPLIALGLTAMLRRRGSGRDIEGALDALIIATGAGALSWGFFMAPYAADAALGVFAKIVSIAYPLGDIVLVAVIVRLLVAPGQRLLSHRLMAVAICGTLVADVVWSVQALSGTYYTGHFVDIGWLVFYWLMGAAALHPSMGAESEAGQRTRRPSRARLVVLAAAASLAPVTLVIQAHRGVALDVPVLAGASIFMFSLVVLRMERLVREVDSKMQQLKVQGKILRGSLDTRDSLESQLRYQALHDPLTDLANRTLFGDRMGHAISHMSRTGHAVSVLFLDLDDFKAINDTLGHEAGDHLLVDVGDRIKRLVRNADTAARLGGDEFAILLDGMAEGVDAHIVTDRILESLGFPFLLEGREVDVHVSIGIAISDDPTVTGQELLRRADVAMYSAKGKGKNGFAVYEPRMQDEVVGRIKLRSELKHAIEQGELRAVYQPIVELLPARSSPPKLSSGGSIPPRG